MATRKEAPVGNSTKLVRGTVARFRLPVGYLTPKGEWLRDGELRLPTQHDKVIVHHLAGEVQNPAYLETLLLTRIIVHLGHLRFDDIAPSDAEEIVGSLALKDVDYLNRVWEHLDHGAAHPHHVRCAECGHRFNPLAAPARKRAKAVRKPKAARSSRSSTKARSTRSKALPGKGET